MHGKDFSECTGLVPRAFSPFPGLWPKNGKQKPQFMPYPTQSNLADTLVGKTISKISEASHTRLIIHFTDDSSITFDAWAKQPPKPQAELIVNSSTGAIVKLTGLDWANRIDSEE